ncbi:MAG: competence/damage-inducible protein A [Bacteroidota bacterium]
MVESNIKAAVITIGDEILIGQIVNTNASWLGQQMNLAGYSVVHMATVPDQGEEIVNELDKAIKYAEIVIITGGLGPTKDDITKRTLAEYFGKSLHEDQDTLEQVTSFFADRGMTLTETNRRQALVPEGAVVLKNENGTAPGMLFEDNGKVVVSLPGVPLEMKHLMTEKVIPYLKKKYKGQHIYHKTIMTHGMGESHLSDLIQTWEESLPAHIKLAYLPRPGIVRLRLSAAGDSYKQIRIDVNKEVQRLVKLIPDLVFGYDDVSLEEVIGGILKQHSKTVATAESCTGGSIAARITSVAGSSAYFKGSVVAYDNDVKSSVLEVSEKALEKHGAVSEEVARQMAAGVMKLLKTDYAIATTGIAGPDGGTKQKPVGTVWIAVAAKNQIKAQRFQFGHQRSRNTERSVLSALNMLRIMLREV